MLVELSIIPLGTDTHLSDEIASVMKVVDDSDLAYQLTPSGTCIEGDWDEVMDLVRRCHEQAREHSPHVITTVKIEDQEGVPNQITSNIRSVEGIVGKTLSRLEPR